MPTVMRTLEQLIQMRNRKVRELSGLLASQQQLCQRYERNIQALQSLSSAPSDAAGHVAMMLNKAQYKKNLQRIIDWQKQEQALAAIKTQQLQRDLLHEARRKKGFQLALEQRRDDSIAEEARKAQKLTDSLAAQFWQRRQCPGR